MIPKRNIITSHPLTPNPAWQHTLLSSPYSGHFTEKESSNMWPLQVAFSPAMSSGSSLLFCALVPHSRSLFSTPLYRHTTFCINPPTCPSSSESWNSPSLHCWFLTSLSVNFPLYLEVIPFLNALLVLSSTSSFSSSRLFPSPFSFQGNFYGLYALEILVLVSGFSFIQFNATKLSETNHYIQAHSTQQAARVKAITRKMRLSNSTDVQRCMWEKRWLPK